MSFAATHSRTYRHLLYRGSHCAGSRAPLDWLTLSVTATNVRWSRRSLAYRFRNRDNYRLRMLLIARGLHP